MFLFLLHAICLNLLPALGAQADYATGVVVDAAGAPVSNAIVRFQGAADFVLSDEQGRFTIHRNPGGKSKYITAWKFGYFNGGRESNGSFSSYRIVLNPIPDVDNARYEWIDPDPANASGTKAARACMSCHPDIMKEWVASSHASSATNSFFLAFYNGSGEGRSKEAAPGYRLDFPGSNGNCATCHVPALALENASADPNKLDRTSRLGVFCDLCHKIKNVSVDRSGGRPGIQSIQFQRPAEGHQLFYGNYDDVFPGEDSYHPLYEKSEYCAPCHNGKFWDVLAYSEFQEWQASDYSARGVTCQACHMPSERKLSRFALEEKGSVFRGPKSIPSHENLGIRNRAFMTESIELKADAARAGRVLNVSISVKNVAAGHHYPTGNPMRNMILLVSATGAGGRDLPMLTGERVPVWGGVGSPAEGNYAGLPGKGFAKVLRDLVPYPADSRRPVHFQRVYPAPHWRPAAVESDTRIPANQVDATSYGFALAENDGPVTVTARLIFRRSFKNWCDAKGLENLEIEIARTTLYQR